MKRHFTVIVLTALLSMTDTWAGEVIAHPSVSLSAHEIRDVFLGEKQLAGGLRLVPVDNSGIQSEFLSKVLQTDARKYTARWTKKSLREGLAAPALMGSDAEVTAFVKSTPGAVGYVTRDAQGVMVLEKF
jgi:ABC-type phosphate transport system substrate-binding protein